DFGVRVDQEGNDTFFVPGNQWYRCPRYLVEPDASAASYFFGAAAMTGGEITIPVPLGRNLQGDFRFTSVLDEMGCHLKTPKTWTSVQGWPLHGVEVDMNDMSDCVMTLAAVACFAEGPTTIRNVAHIRHK